MANLICRICLRTEEPLIELTERLLHYFEEICYHTSGYATHLCCSVCTKTLQNNLDFRNKCLKSNAILLEWKKNESQEKTSLQSLYKLLDTSSNETKVDNDIRINEDGIELCIVQNSDIVDVKIERIKEEDVIFEDNGVNFDILNCESVNGKRESKQKMDGTKNGQKDIQNDEKGTKNDEKGTKNDEKGTKTDEQGLKKNVPCKKIYVQCMNNDLLDMNNDQGANGTDDSDDDRPLVICMDEPKETQAVKTDTKADKRLYQRKSIREYSEYETVFDVQLFETDQEARTELVGRRMTEPYVSARFRCEFCYTVYKCNKLLQFHMKWHDLSSSDPECDICSMQFVSKKTLQSHKAKCHRGKFSCKLCPLVTYYGSAMKAHFQKHQGKKYKCHCGNTFSHISSYLSHKRNAHVSKHVCDQCARTFVSAHGLISHRQKMHPTVVQENGAAVRCEPCDVTFVNQLIYNVHLLNTDTHKDVAKDMIACRYCGLLFDSIKELNVHKRQQHPKKSHTNDILKCELCGAEGKGRVWRFRHYAAEHPQINYLEKVSEAKKHMCDQCGKLFSNVTTLKDHMNIHLGVRPYACECGATFTSMVSRTQHAQRHAAPRACDHCDATFRSTANLAVHMRRHTGVRRYVCKICSKKFLHRGSLREHERGVHENNRRKRGKSDKSDKPVKR